MTATTDKQRSGKQGKARSAHEKATIIVCARATSQTKAGKEFDVAARSIGRWEAQIAAGKLPKVADLVAAKEAEQARKHSDKLDAAYDRALTELESKLSGASVEELTEAVKVLADARLNRDVLLNEPVGYRPGASAAAPARQDPRGAGAPSAVARGAGAAGSGSPDPVH